ncbi:proline-specific peptidase [Auriculariales sp. MPI-PUGE-AT-0066]|nr:proline-specific peptidase [Auriculariales sp. MPI-PUGE-AT-0066]
MKFSFSLLALAISSVSGAAVFTRQTQGTDDVTVTWDAAPVADSNARASIQPPLSGDVKWTIPGSKLAVKTHFKVWGWTKIGVTPLVVLHGGPGIPSNYLTPLSDLGSSMPVIIYDQVGCGTSTHFADQMGNTTFWTEGLFITELWNVLKGLGIVNNFSLMGHSWGGILASRRSKKLILASTPATIPLWLEAANKLRSELPAQYRDALNKHEADGTTDDPEYVGAVDYFYSLHVIRIAPYPADVQASFDGLGVDPTVYLTMNGPNEFSISGPLKTWDGSSFAKKVNVPTLLTNGKYDEGQDSAIAPYTTWIKNVQWTHFQNSSHMAFWEERSLYISTVKKFLL